MADFKPITTLKADRETVQHISGEVHKTCALLLEINPILAKNFEQKWKHFLKKKAVNFIDMRLSIKLYWRLAEVKLYPCVYVINLECGKDRHYVAYLFTYFK